jgi:hypothetical protein
MKQSSQDAFKELVQQFLLVSKKRERKERSDRRWQSIKDGWDVSGARWRIGWGGLDDQGGRDADQSDRRH